MKILNTQVLIIGAGPTGLMAANQLARLGIDFIIIDKKSGPTKESRAIVVTARSLEIYQQMGLSDLIVENGQKLIEAQLFNRGKVAATIEVGELGKGLSDFTYLLAYEQSKNETLLAQNIENRKLKIHWGWEFQQIKKSKGGITAEVLDNHAQAAIIEARYLIACDGATSPVRHQMGFQFEGGTYDHKFFVMDTVFDWPEAQHRVVIVPGDDNFFAFLPLKGNNSFRIVGTLPPDYADNENIQFSDLHKEVNKTLGRVLEFQKVNWFSIYRLHHRMVNQFRKDNVFLAGDAAHIHSPAGGQGMNTGLQDAYNLCWKLALVLKGQAAESLLDTYEEERMPFARFLLRFTDRAFSNMTSRNWFIKNIRKLLLPIVAPRFGKIASAKPFIFKLLSQTAWTYKDSSLSRNFSKQKLKFSAGDRFPYLAEENVYPRLINPGYHFVVIADTQLSEQQKTEIAARYKFPVYWIELTISRAWKDLGVKKPLLLVVRPDNYIQEICELLSID